jgi:hypothetical protein
MDHEDVFTNRAPTPAQAETLDKLTAGMLELDELLAELLPDSRYRSLARTKLEECSMWAKKAAIFTTGQS